jgi:hypothetical protein
LLFPSLFPGRPSGLSSWNRSHENLIPPDPF